MTLLFLAVAVPPASGAPEVVTMLLLGVVLVSVGLVRRSR